MPKMKTRKAIAKRFKVTKTGKIKKRVTGQDHFNARETGKVRRHKRRAYIASKTLKGFMDIAMPN
ncbi:MAG: 50S ribosomal protein L35 [Candidatus Magasanikbacteria bacterium RIFOXYC2_FULL_42_28]|uniref:Large ribosomal subunit protein bL35 n=1 Tax=Candidatus Magasanikbacteria bacterium RIFOXYC2_FULL_42_28 TaxID=1798704 RepID=A0A1F6NWG9_9BACT|nr:MAG: 50S ribosomal protein L35 [Candidatus Magasanikbacteria bacterium RIFOXYC2_FULL_42_28]